MELMACQDMAVPMEVMEHVVRVESSFNPYAIGVVGARLARQPRSLEEAVATAARLERDGYNFSLGLAQVNRHNLAAQGLASYEEAFATCPNLAAGARILADCHARSGGDWDKAFSCYYSGNFTRGIRDGYVQKIRRSMSAAGVGPVVDGRASIPVLVSGQQPAQPRPAADLRARRSATARPVATLPDPGDGPAIGDAPSTDLAGGAAGPATAAAGPFVPRVSGPGTPPAPWAPRGGDSAFVF
ncbi:lytic transglycosylase domain-containing protein [Luteimonas sp. MJ246]|uniref:lytic transglycosylase domain-containing protein n=1 Tax=Luteimonas sp. MJ174 TaxID=3129237 RepID=UPI0031B9F2C5